MDKYELKVSLDEIDRLIAERRFAEAAEVADTIDWTRVKGVHVLCRISDLYKINKRYKDSRDLMEMAYERNPSGRKIIYSLCELELKLNNYIHALQLYNAFINVAPRDSDRFLLQYKLYKKQDVNVYEQIAVLEEFLQHDFRERWAYELAALYLRAGEEQRCIRQCDEIVAYFGDGRFVIRALELKKSLTPLTPQQEERLEILKSGGTIEPPAPVQEETAEAETGAEDENAGDGESAAAEEGEKTADSGKEAAAAQQEKAAAAQQEKAAAAQQEKAAAAQQKKAAAAQREKAAAVQQKEAAAAAPRAETASAASRAEAVPEESAKTPVNPLQGESDSAAEEKASSEPQKIVIDARMVMPNAASGKIPSAGTSSRRGRADQAQKSLDEETDEEEENADAAEPSATPEEYTDALLREVNMQETIARGMREIGDYDNVLAQETNGQLAMVMEEERPEETQIDGQLNLAQIMSEWEKIRKDSEQQRLAEARRRILEKSDAAKRELYGDDYAETGSADTGSVQSSEKSGTTRSWKKEDIESGLRDRNKS